MKYLEGSYLRGLGPRQKIQKMREIILEALKDGALTTKELAQKCVVASVTKNNHPAYKALMALAAEGKIKLQYGPTRRKIMLISLVTFAAGGLVVEPPDILPKQKNPIQETLDELTQGLMKIIYESVREKVKFEMTMKNNEILKLRKQVHDLEKELQKKGNSNMNILEEINSKTPQEILS